MRIGLYHNWELRGSGSNEYSRYLAAALNQAGHEVHVICREPEPERIDSISRIVTWDLDGRPVSRRPGRKTTGAPLVLHVLPVGDVAPVYVTDKQREGPVKAFVHLSDAELDGYLRSTTRVLAAILATTRLDVLHVNHVVPQPSVAADACRDLGIPFVIYPHGSAIEYAVRRDERYRRMASDAIGRAAGLIIGSREVMNRLLELCPERRDRIASRTKIIGVGVDTSLFTPVARGERETAVARLIAKAPGGGKSGDLVDELRRRLDRGDLEAVRDYRDAYPHDLPDADVAARLKRLPFSDGRILLFVGALTVGKGLQRVIVALPGILAEVPDAHLVIVGSGAYREVLEGLVHAIASGNEALLDALVAKGNDLDDTHLEGPWEAVAAYLSAPGNRRTVLSAGRRFAEHVHFTGRMSHDLLCHLFPCADVAVFPSVIPEAYPLVLMESLSNGVLPAASDFSGFAEGLDHLVPELGRELVQSMRLPVDPATCVAGMVERLSSLLAQPRDDARKARLRDIAVRRYDWKIRAREMAAAYDDLRREDPTSAD